jgi:hypothetical protein
VTRCLGSLTSTILVRSHGCTVHSPWLHSALQRGGPSGVSVVCAGQRPDQEGSSPSGARMRSAVSKSGGNASLAEESGKVWRRLLGHEGESRKHARRTWSRRSLSFGGQGVRREAESEGYAEKYRAVVNGGHPNDEPVGQRWGKVEPALWGRRRSHPPTAPRCLRSARYGRSERDPRRVSQDLRVAPREVTL